MKAGKQSQALRTDPLRPRRGCSFLGIRDHCPLAPGRGVSRLKLLSSVAVGYLTVQQRRRVNAIPVPQSATSCRRRARTRGRSLVLCGRLQRWVRLEFVLSPLLPRPVATAGADAAPIPVGRQHGSAEAGQRLFVVHKRP